MILLLALALVATLGGGILLGGWLDRLVSGRQAGPLRAVAALAVRGRVRTEAPDDLNRRFAPALYLALAAIGLSIVPFAPGAALIESPVGIVIWGSCEALAIIAIFLHGWSPNSIFPLIGAYRYVAIALPVMLPSMFVLIAAALPAESLSMTAIVESQRDLWNVARQPLGLPLFVMVALILTLRGPMDYADAADLVGGTSAEESGGARLAWEIARLAMLVSVSAMAAAVFLAGPLGPVLPGPVWLWLKTVSVMALVVFVGHHVARTTPSRMLGLVWTVVLPLSFLHLAIAGVMAL